MTPKVSVIIPVFNRQAALDACLQSICEQDYPADKIETIVVNDSSTDKSRSVAFARRAKVIDQEKLGLNIARNVGASAAIGEYLIFTLPDFQLGPRFISTAIENLIVEPETAFAGYIRTDSHSLTSRLTQLKLDFQGEVNYNKACLFALAFSKETFQDVGGFNAMLPDDALYDNELSTRMDFQQREIVDDPLMKVWHTHPTSIGQYLETRFHEGVLAEQYPQTRTPYTRSDEVQSISLYSALALLLLNIILPGVAWLSIISAAICAQFLARFFQYSITRDPEAAIWSPLLLPLGNLAFGLGSVSGLVRLWREIRSSTKQTSHKNGGSNSDRRVL